MPSSNSVFVSVNQTPRLENVGFELRCIDAANYGTPGETLLAVSPPFMAMAFSLELAGLGGGSITFSLDSELFTRTLPNGEPAKYLYEAENLWQVYEDGELRAEWLGQDVSESWVSDRETRAVTISGPGTATSLSWASVLTKNFPNGKANDFWRFTNTPSMSVWLQLLQAAQSRGTCALPTGPVVTPTFTTTSDSNGVGWTDTGPAVSNPDNKRADYTPVVGTNLLDLLTYLTGQDPTQPSPLILDWYMRPGFKLDVAPKIGTDRHNYVVFNESGSIVTKERTRSREDVGNYAVVLDIYGNRSLAVDMGSVHDFKQREVFAQKDRPTSPALRAQMALTFLKQRRFEKSTWTIKVLPDKVGRRVFVDYDIGDSIGIEADDYSVVPYRVMAIAIQVDENGITDLELTLQSLFDLRAKELQRSVTKLDSAIGPGSANTIPYSPPTAELDGTIAEPATNDVLAYSQDTGTYSNVPISDLTKGVGAVYVQSTEPLDAAEHSLWVDYP